MEKQAWRNKNKNVFFLWGKKKGRKKWRGKEKNTICRSAFSPEKKKYDATNTTATSNTHTTHVHAVQQHRVVLFFFVTATYGIPQEWYQLTVVFIPQINWGLYTIYVDTIPCTYATTAPPDKLGVKIIFQLGFWGNTDGEDRRIGGPASAKVKPQQTSDCSGI